MRKRLRSFFAFREKIIIFQVFELEKKGMGSRMEPLIQVGAAAALGYTQIYGNGWDPSKMSSGKSSRSPSPSLSCCCGTWGGAR